MKPIRFFRMVFLFLFCSLLCCSCGKKPSGSGQSTSDKTPYEPGKINVLIPETGTKDTVGCDFLTLDFTNANQGYFTGVLTASNKKINLQVTGPDQIIYKYFLNDPDDFAVFPLTAGDGAYLVLAFEDVGNGQYASLFSYSLNVVLDSQFLPYLYPNQYVNFSQDSEAISLAASLSRDAATDLDALTAIYQYITGHITYDNDKAATVQSGYLPDIDETLKTGTGICFDYAALACAMLRSLSIPARLDIGYSSDVRHAWIDVYIESIGWVERAVEFNGDEWKIMDPTFDAAGDGSEAIQEYIGDQSNYTLQYVR